MSHILLIRHATNEWVNKKRLAGWTPGVHLDDQGQEEVRQLSERLAHLPISAIYSSPLERCIETAEAIDREHGVGVNELEDIGEVRYGKWEGKKIKKLAKKRSWYAVQHYPSRFRFPEGESLREVQQRSVSALEQLAMVHEEEMIAVVSHADVIRLLLAHYLGMHIDLFQRIGIAPASVSLVVLSNKGPVRVVRLNDNGPIQAPEKPSEQEDGSKESHGLPGEDVPNNNQDPE